MLILKGTLLGVLFFAIGIILFMVVWFRRIVPPGQHGGIAITVVTHLTIHNYWFWVALVACLVSGLRHSPLFAG